MFFELFFIECVSSFTHVSRVALIEIANVVFVVSIVLFLESASNHDKSHQHEDCCRVDFKVNTSSIVTRYHDCENRSFREHSSIYEYYRHVTNVWLLKHQSSLCRSFVDYQLHKTHSLRANQAIFEDIQFKRR